MLQLGFPLGWYWQCFPNCEKEEGVCIYKYMCMYRCILCWWTLGLAINKYKVYMQSLAYFNIFRLVKLTQYISLNECVFFPQHFLPIHVGLGNKRKVSVFFLSTLELIFWNLYPSRQHHLCFICGYISGLNIRLETVFQLSCFSSMS